MLQIEKFLKIDFPKETVHSMALDERNYHAHAQSNTVNYCKSASFSFSAHIKSPLSYHTVCHLWHLMHASVTFDFVQVYAAVGSRISVHNNSPNFITTTLHHTICYGFVADTTYHLDMSRWSNSP